MLKGSTGIENLTEYNNIIKDGPPSVKLKTWSEVDEGTLMPGGNN